LSEPLRFDGSPHHEDEQELRSRVGEWRLPLMHSAIDIACHSSQTTVRLVDGLLVALLLGMDPELSQRRVHPGNALAVRPEVRPENVVSQDGIVGWKENRRGEPIRFHQRAADGLVAQLRPLP